MSLNKVLYDSLEEYENLVHEFKSSLPNIIREDELDDWTYTDYNYEQKFGLQFSKSCSGIYGALSKLTKNKNEQWVIMMGRVISNAIRGIAYSVNNMKSSTNILCECCGVVTTHDDCEIFLKREMCNTLMVNMIFGIICDDGQNQDENELSNIRQFNCKNCGGIDYIDGEFCQGCYKKHEMCIEDLETNNL